MKPNTPFVPIENKTTQETMTWEDKKLVSTENRSPKRKRGVILTVQGWKRLQAAKRESEIQENSGNHYTLEDLRDRTALSINTLTRIQRRQTPVDRHSLESFFSAFQLTLNPNDYTKLEQAHLESQQRVTLKGQVPLNSPFYVERPPIERLGYESIVHPGALIRIKAPKQMGKTSLMAKILAHARTKGYKTVTLSFQLADSTVFSNLTRFLQWFCAIVTRSLGVPNQLAEYWDDIFGSNYNCTDYFENYLLAAIDTPIVLALDEVDVVFNYPEIATDFFGLLRAWYEKTKYGDDSSDIWQNLRLLVVHSTEVYIPLNINQSPFNVGFSIELPDFTREQVQDLATRYELNWTTEYVEQLMALIGGNPYLVQLALHHISREEITLEQLLETAVAEDGIYSNYLRRQLWNLKQYPELASALIRVVRSESPVELEPLQAFKLQSMGLVRVQNQQVMPGCMLYRQYFSDRLSRLQLNLIQESRLATILFTDAVNFEDNLKADPERTQAQLYQDFQLITQLAQQFEGQILKSFGARLLIYFPSALNAVNCAQEILLALKQSTELIAESVLTHSIGIHLGEIIFSCSDIIGTGIKVAECLQSEAPSGGICISQAVYEAVKNHLSLQPINLGQRQFEGIEEPISLYQLEV
ncbi:AAA-like domain-containing protein [Allocoleopsis sp.]|uniref:AAA-like domain-containing protein n=1 Tax=Allocoleopsis sp. TaxID=3088169 RepID=UPI002FCFE06B